MPELNSLAQMGQREYGSHSRSKTGVLLRNCGSDLRTLNIEF